MSMIFLCTYGVCDVCKLKIESIVEEKCGFPFLHKYVMILQYNWVLMEAIN